MVERVSHAAGTVSNERRVVVIGGIQATDYKMRGVAQSFGDIYGEENVNVFDSPISTGTPNPDRAANIRRAVTPVDGQVTLVTHSLGSTDVDLIDSQSGVTDKVREVHISPSGAAKGIRRKARYVRDLVMDKLPLGMGRNSFAAFPSAYVTQEMLRELFPKKSHVGKGYESVEIIPLNDNRDRLTSEQLQAMHQTDVAIAQAHLNKRRRKAKQLIRRRGRSEVVGDPLRQFYADVPTGEKKGKLHLGKAGLKALLRGAGTKPVEEMRQLKEAGHAVEVWVTEIDIVSPEWFDGLPVRVIPGLTHDSILFQPRAIATAVAASDRPRDAIITS